MHSGNTLGMPAQRKPYPSNVSDEVWEFCDSYLTVYPIILDGATSVCLDYVNFQKEFGKHAR
jgi:hypothetical protein